jgi:ABC-type multidrug transport system fused ATPase/permease subunit
MLQITGYMVILYTLIGWPCFAGLVLMILAGPVQGVIMKRLFGLNRAMVQYTDDRVKTTNEAVQGIRCVKMYTWENSISKMIQAAREQELEFLKRMAYLRGFSRAYMSALPGIVAMTSFVVYSLNGGTPSASTLFAALTAFGQLRFPLLFYPMALAQYAQASVSAKRIEAFLRMEEVGTGEPVGDVAPDSKETEGKEKAGIYNGKLQESLKVGEVTVKDVTIYWRNPDIPLPVGDDASSTLDQSIHSVGSKKSDGSSKKVVQSNVDVEIESVPELRYPQPILSSVDLDVSPGELCAIVGRVGSGKSTLCSAILNETVLRGGEVALKGTVAYAAQSAWILNATLQDNITFGMPYEKEKYDSIIRACQLTHDLDLLDAGDQTEIGENGINLSGGQKQRVSIARAAYSCADIVILDDPLSALDPEVGKLLFEECILKFMKGKTRIFVTNQLQCLHFLIFAFQLFLFVQLFHQIICSPLPHHLRNHLPRTFDSRPSIPTD